MSDALRLCSFAMVGALCSLFIKKTNPNISVICALISGAMLILAVIGSIGDVFYGIKTVTDAMGASGNAVRLAMKIMGISLTFDVSARLLERMGEGAVAKNLETAGRVVLLSMTLPTLFDLFELVDSLLTGVG